MKQDTKELGDILKECEIDNFKVVGNTLYLEEYLGKNPRLGNIDKNIVVRGDFKQLFSNLVKVSGNCTALVEDNLEVPYLECHSLNITSKGRRATIEFKKLDSTWFICSRVELNSSNIEGSHCDICGDSKVGSSNIEFDNCSCSTSLLVDVNFCIMEYLEVLSTSERERSFYTVEHAKTLYTFLRTNSEVTIENVTDMVICLTGSESDPKCSVFKGKVENLYVCDEKKIFDKLHSFNNLKYRNIHFIDMNEFLEFKVLV